MNNIMEVRGLRKSYGSFTLNDISFDVPSGYIMGFIGPNGAGKTTTIKLILNVIRSDSGSVRLFGSDTGIQNEEVGVVMDAPLYVDDWKVRDVESALSPFYKKQWDKREYRRLNKYLLKR